MINKIIDLHNHSTASDGTLTPTQLADLAKNIGLAAAAITDHDTVDGVAEFVKRCNEIGVEPVPGVEISAKYDVEMHILGLFIDPENTQLKEKLHTLKTERISRNYEMLKKIRALGMDISEQDVTGQKEDGHLQSCGRAHIARAMVEKGYIKSIQEGFDKYIGKGECCYVERQTFSIRESIRLIKDAGGLAILAHPIYITRAKNQLRDLLTELKYKGLDGVECYYSQYPKDYMETVLSVAEELDLLPSGGSDFHADNKADVKMGVVCGDMSVPYSVLENMKARLG